MGKFQLGLAIGAFIFAVTLIPMAKMRKKGQGAQIWRMIAMALLVLAAAAAMFSPAFSH